MIAIMSNLPLYRRVLKVSLPLVISISAIMVMEITDRIFLSGYSLDAIAAVTPAGILAFVFIAFFMGLVSYVNVFVAQYTGAGDYQKVGSALWQGIYTSLAAAILLALLALTAETLFRWGGHAPEIQRLEVIYFKILVSGGGIHVLGTAFASFFTGRGLTRPVMLVNLIGMLINIPLNYMLINGIGGFPEMGIAGAGIATVVAWVVITLLLGLLLFNAEHDLDFGVYRARAFNPALFRRLLRFGVPGALQFCLDTLGFVFFVWMVGRIGTQELAVSNMVLSVNSLAYMPMLGVSLGTSTLVGQALGRGSVETAIQITRATLTLVRVYILVLILVFIGLPHLVLEIFRPRGLPAAEFEAIVAQGRILLRFVAAFIFFDAQYMVYVGVLKGAGDTRFIMLSIGTLSLFVMILPIVIGVQYFNAGLYFCWGCVTVFIFCLYTVSWQRYRRGKWQGMRVIETDKITDPSPPSDKIER